ncbi:uncharacterized protein RJT20DRAFT_51185 [Scheffersomyces xylosifermentans]|uniref:uncharacterized protein n=1 Tax=Scheffersomyces xylosifermentans TaxID=1304137 RepID=UPI00315C5656
MSRNLEYPIVLVKNLPYNTSSAALYDLFGKYGSINQLRLPDDTSSQSKLNLGSCFIIYNNLANAQRAASELNGVNFSGRYLVASLFQVDKSNLTSEDMIVRKEQLTKLKQMYGIE